jgi:hypothetical protein
LFQKMRFVLQQPCGTGWYQISFSRAQTLTCPDPPTSYCLAENQGSARIYLTMSTLVISSGMALSWKASSLWTLNPDYQYRNLSCHLSEI